MEKYREIERSIIKKYRKEIWSKFIKAIKDYNETTKLNLTDADFANMQKVNKGTNKNPNWRNTRFQPLCYSA